MKSFLKKIFVFNIPLTLIILLLITILYIRGEIFTPLDKLIKSKEKYLIGYEFNDQNYAYLKWKTIDLKDRYDIIALGSSRVLPFRENMFKTSFYNAGYTIEKADDFVPFLEGISSEKYPKVLVVALDQWMFNQEWNKAQTLNKDSLYWKNSYTTNFTFSLLKQVAVKIYQREYSITDLLKKKDSINKIGIQAQIKNTGFRKDGSMYYGKLIESKLNNDTTYLDYNFKDTYNRIENGNRRFEYANDIDKTTINKIEQLIDFCTKHNIHLIAFLPPYADAVMKKMKEVGKYSYLDKIDTQIKPLFVKKGFEYYNFSTMKSINSNDTETSDGFHGNEVAYQRLLIEMLQQNSKLNEFADLEKLKKDLQNLKNERIVYDY